MTRLVAWWDGHVPDALTRFRLPFVEKLAEGGPLAPAVARAAWDEEISRAGAPVVLAPEAPKTRVAEELAADGDVRAGWRELREHRRAVAGAHWRLLLELVRALETRPAQRPDLVAIRVTALADLAPVAQHAGHLRHALSLANDVSLRAATLADAREATLLATRPVAPRPRTARAALRLDKRRRVVHEDAPGWWRGAPPAASAPGAGARPSAGGAP